MFQRRERKTAQFKPPGFQNSAGKALLNLVLRGFYIKYFAVMLLQTKAFEDMN